MPFPTSLAPRLESTRATCHSNWASCPSKMDQAELSPRHQRRHQSQRRVRRPKMAHSLQPLAPHLPFLRHASPERASYESYPQKMKFSVRCFNHGLPMPCTVEPVLVTFEEIDTSSEPASLKRLILPICLGLNATDCTTNYFSMTSNDRNCNMYQILACCSTL